MDRRTLLQGGLAAGLIGLPTVARAQALNLIPIRVDAPAVFRTTVCLRPFRAVGPRIEAEALGRKTVVHNYGHGGSGWSLSWGSAAEAVRLAMQSSPKRIAVIGAGALGLTAAITAQRAGAQVTIHARERFPFVRSARATGMWTPDSRIAKTASAAPDFGDHWERMARTALTMHEAYVGLAGNPVEWLDNYSCRHPLRPLNPDGGTPDTVAAPPPPPAEDPGFIELRSRLVDVMPRSVEIQAGAHPFNASVVRRNVTLSFNVADYSHQLESDFLAAGGRFEVADFKTPHDLSRVKDSVLINCTGYGARALFGDDNIVPVRGQIVWLAPQEGVHYGIGYGSLGIVARRDGIVVQEYGPDDNFGFGDDNETVDTVAAQAAIDRLRQIYL